MPMRQKWYGAAALLAAGALSGGILAGTLSAQAATGSGSSSGSTYSGTDPRGPAPDGAAPYGASPGGGHAGETVLTGSDAAKAKAAALKAVPGGTVDRVETDSGDATYEAHLTKADGTQVTVKLDRGFAVTQVEDGMGK